MSKGLMVLGTCSDAGKSIITAGICRILHSEGYRVAPFKAQNMALNSYITEDGGEMGRAQVVQAEACKIKPDVRMNPILLKPSSDNGSQVILHGKVVDNNNARQYYSKKDYYAKEALKAYKALAADYDVIILEGAGSASEINLRDKDIVNMGMARMADVPVIIVGDIDRGGVFGSLVGTMQLFTEEERKRVKGFIINKFRGDLSILEPGLRELENITGVPVIGVVPYMDIDIDEEDSLSSHIKAEASSDKLIDIAVPRLPRISNFTDLNALRQINEVNVRYVTSSKNFGNPDLVVIPGSKNTMDDLKWLRASGIEAQILKHASKKMPVFGICGGFQMLGERLDDPLGVEAGGSMRGMGLLPVETTFEGEKITRATEGMLDNVGGIFSNLSGQSYKAYEIHMGRSTTDKNIINNGNVYGTYFHGIFDTVDNVKVIIDALLRTKGMDDKDLEIVDMQQYKDRQYDILAEGMKKSLNMDLLHDIIKNQ